MTEHKPIADAASAMPRPGRLELMVLIAGLMALNALAIDIMLPALGLMAADLGLTASPDGSDNRQQLIIIAYTLGFGVPQLLWGPVTDTHGRRGPLFLAIGGYIIAALGCILVKDFTFMLVMRFIQGTFAAGARIAVNAMVRDMFAGRAMASFMSLTMTIFMIVPILAPVLGQGILLFAPWEATFVVLVVFAVIFGIWAHARLPETLPREARRALNVRSVLSAYGQTLQSRVTFGYMAASGTIFGALFAYVAASEQVLRVVFDEGARFALWFAVTAGALAIANFVNSKIVVRFGMRRVGHWALVAFTLLAGLNLLLTLAFGENLYRFMFLFALNFGCFGMIGSNFSALAMEPLGKIAGTGSAVYGFATNVISAAIGFAIGAQFDGTTLPLLGGFLLIGLVSLAIVLWTERGRLFSAH